MKRRGLAALRNSEQLAKSPHKLSRYRVHTCGRSCRSSNSMDRTNRWYVSSDWEYTCCAGIVSAVNQRVRVLELEFHTRMVPLQLSCCCSCCEYPYWAGIVSAVCQRVRVLNVGTALCHTRLVSVQLSSCCCCLPPQLSFPNTP